MKILKIGSLMLLSLCFFACDDSDEEDVSPSAIDQGHPALGTVPDLQLPDLLPLDAAPLDAAPLDAAPLDAAPLDAAPLDAAPLDLLPLDVAMDIAPDTEATRVTWESRIDHIFRLRCVRCHSWAGSYNRVARNINPVRSYTERNHFIGGEEKQVTLDWIADGYPEN